MNDGCCSIRLGCQTHELPLTIQSYHRTAYRVKLVKDAQTNIPFESQLPQDLVIKPLKEDTGLEGTDERETSVYEKLYGLQGRLIPRYYGVGDFCHNGKTVKAHVLELVNGTPLTEIDKAGWKTLDIERKIEAAYTELSRHGVKHMDVEARHIFLVPGSESLMLIDFGIAQFCDYEKAKSQNTNDVAGLMRERDM
jgi:predicted Ser/Thr protein kinase